MSQVHNDMPGQRANIPDLQSKETRKLLDIVDELRALPSISHEIDLPQIVVVGQQSSGKSSVLNAISNINFPTNSGFCTQFATEIICRREAKPKAKVSIIRRTPRDAAYDVRLEAFSRRWDEVRIDQDIAEIITSAKQAMGLNEHRRISRDILRLEFSGPDQDHISLIDLPGLYDQNLPGQREDDKTLVDNMVGEYISAQQSIILAVVSGASDIQVQRIFKEFQPHSDRVIGVITAPDMVEAETDRATTFQKLVANALFNAGHEWYVVRNLSPGELRAGAKRDEVEAQFIADRLLSANAVWKTVPDSRLGIQNLKSRLAVLLKQSIVRRLPGIQQQLATALQACEQELMLLGDERSTPEQQRDYLVDRGEKLRKRTENELRGETGRRTLRSKIRNENDNFVNNMWARGATYTFEDGAAGQDTQISFDKCVAALDEPISTTMAGWVTSMYDKINDSRGRELPGQINDVWVGIMFNTQSMKWAGLAGRHADETFNIVMEYFDEVIEEIVGSEHAARFLEHAIHPELHKRQEALKSKVVELLSPYATQYIRTLNRQYDQRSPDNTSSLWKGTDQRTQAQNTIARLTNDMRSYYSVALNVFADNIESLAIENVLLGGLDDILTIKKVYNMEEMQLRAIAAESEDVSNKRSQLKNRIEDYERGCRSISPYAIRHRRVAHDNVRSLRAAPAALRPQGAAPTIVIAPASTFGAAEFPSHDQQLDSSDSSSTVHGGQSSDRQSRMLRTSTSSRASSVSSVFSNVDVGEEGASQASSANPSPFKSPGAASVSASPSKNRSSRSKHGKSAESNNDGNKSVFEASTHVFGEPSVNQSAWGRSPSTGSGVGSSNEFGNAFAKVATADGLFGPIASKSNVANATANTLPKGIRFGQPNSVNIDSEGEL